MQTHGTRSQHHVAVALDVARMYGNEVIGCFQRLEVSIVECGEFGQHALDERGLGGLVILVVSPARVGVC